MATKTTKKAGGTQKKTAPAGQKAFAVKKQPGRQDEGRKKQQPAARTAGKKNSRTDADMRQIDVPDIRRAPGTRRSPVR